MSVEHVPRCFRSVYLTGPGREASYSALNGWASHTLAESPLAVTIREPLGLNAADTTDSDCPLSVRTAAPLRASQSFAVWSELPVTKIWVEDRLKHPDCVATAGARLQGLSWFMKCAPDRFVA
jgi:hypothetical protein